jgi:pimeloyl-ACP methyl ester carboxylesterase
VRLKKLATQRMLESRPSGLHSDLIACDRFETGDQLRSINCPALVIHGEDDKMIPIAQARFLAASIPNARLEIVPKAGHMVMLENPKVVSDKITEFFAAISS